MSCPYFEEGSFGTCCASESRYVPTIAMMEKYCFAKGYGLCPILLSYERALYREVC